MKKITLDVRGTHYITTEENLEKSEWFQGFLKHEKPINGLYFIDRDPKAFYWVLQCITTEIMPEEDPLLGMPYIFVAKELEYFGLGTISISTPAPKKRKRISLSVRNTSFYPDLLVKLKIAIDSRDAKFRWGGKRAVFKKSYTAADYFRLDDKKKKLTIALLEDFEETVLGLELFAKKERIEGSIVYSLGAMIRYKELKK